MARPRTHPEGTSAADRVAMHGARLKAAGGGRRSYAFGPDTMAALAAILARAGDRSETALIARLLREELARLP